MRANIRYYCKKHANHQLKSIADELSRCIEDMNKGSAVETLMLTEARARQLYYGAFNCILDKPGFRFDKRTKQPPLDPKIGIVHATNKRNYSLNLDFADIFKPIIVDRVIFSLVNLQQLNAETDFEKTDNGGIYLSKEGKRVFIEQFEKKLADKITVKGKELTYRRLMEEEVWHYQHFVEKGESYRPYKYY